MKKRGLCLTTSALIAILPTLAKAHGFWNTRSYRTHWSPYSHSLVQGDVKYSPYAFNHKNPGLVSRDVRWSPYSHSLVSKNNSRSSFFFPCHFPTYINILTSCSPNTNNLSKNLSERINQESTNPKTSTRIQIPQRTKIRELQKNDPAFTIRNCLINQGIEFKTTYGSNTSNKTIRTHFLIEDRRIIIKYINPAETKNLKEHELKFYKRFKKKSENFCEKQKKLGWKIFSIKSDDLNETSKLVNKIINSQ